MSAIRSFSTAFFGRLEIDSTRVIDFFQEHSVICLLVFLLEVHTHQGMYKVLSQQVSSLTGSGLWQNCDISKPCLFSISLQCPVWNLRPVGIKGLTQGPVVHCSLHCLEDALPRQAQNCKIHKTGKIVAYCTSLKGTFQVRTPKV